MFRWAIPICQYVRAGKYGQLLALLPSDELDTQLDWAMLKFLQVVRYKK